jgi:tRNA threonylcarbamoyladenosine biosynthesis protein TsaB
MTCTIHIDTTSNQQIKVGLTIDEQEYLINLPTNHQKAQVVLPLIQKILQQHNLQLANIQKITVNPGPGSFTGVRVGLSIANALGFLLKIPVNQLPIGQPAEAIY